MVMIDRKGLENEISIILKTPRMFIITIIILSGLFYLLFDKVIYKTILDNYESIIKMRDESIQKCQSDYNALLKRKDTLKLHDTIRIENEKTKHDFTQQESSKQPLIQNYGNGSIVTQNQKGGENSVYNERPIARTIKGYRDKMIEELKKLKPIDYGIDVLANDMESWNLAVEIKNAFESAGWKKQNIRRGFGGIYPPGFTVCRDKETKQSEIITVLLLEAGLKGALMDDFKKEHCDKIRIYLGPNPDNYLNTPPQNIEMVPRKFK